LRGIPSQEAWNQNDGCETEFRIQFPLQTGVWSGGKHHYQGLETLVYFPHRDMNPGAICVAALLFQIFARGTSPNRAAKQVCPYCKNMGGLFHQQHFAQ